jgi:hypothetical protein
MHGVRFGACSSKVEAVFLQVQLSIKAVVGQERAGEAGEGARGGVRRVEMGSCWPRRR